MEDDEIEVWKTAYRHGYSKADIFHALRNPLKAVYGNDDMYMIIGPAENGAVIEVGFGDTGAIVHAMDARSKYWP